MFNHSSQRQVRDALRTRNGPNVSDVQKLQLGGPALVCRIHHDKCDSRFPLLDRNEGTCRILADRVPNDFRSTAIKSYHYPSTDLNQTADENQSSPPQHSPPQQSPLTAAPPMLSCNPFLALFTKGSKQQRQIFLESGMKEVRGLMKHEVWKVIRRDSAHGHHILRNTFCW